MEHRLKACGLELHPDKTKIVYRGRKQREKSYPIIAYDFLGYTFKRRKAQSKLDLNFTSFLPANSNKAKVSIREKMRTWQLHRRGGSDLKKRCPGISIQSLEDGSITMELSTRMSYTVCFITLTGYWYGGLCGNTKGYGTEKSER